MGAILPNILSLTKNTLAASLFLGYRVFSSSKDGFESGAVINVDVATNVGNG